MAYFLDDGRLVVDNSTLSSFATCGTQAYMQYALNLRPPPGSNLPADSGIAIHGALDAYFSTGSRSAALLKLEELYADYADQYAAADDRLCFDNIERCFQGWLDKYPFHELPYEVVEGSIEAPFLLPLTDNVVYGGRLDALVRPKGSKGLWLLDTKSTGRVDAKFKAQFSIGSQMSGYYWAAEQLYKERIQGIYINVVHTGKVPSSDRKCATHSRPYSECGVWHMNHGVHKYTRSKEEIDSWLADARVMCEEWYEVATRHEAEEWPTPNFATLQTVDQRGKWVYQACALCVYHQFCQQQRKPQFAARNFVYNEWIPGGADAQQGKEEA